MVARLNLVSMLGQWPHESDEEIARYHRDLRYLRNVTDIITVRIRAAPRYVDSSVNRNPHFFLCRMSDGTMITSPSHAR